MVAPCWHATSSRLPHRGASPPQSALCHSSSVKRDTDLATAYSIGMTPGGQLTAKKPTSRPLQGDREGSISLPSGSNPYSNCEVVASGVGVRRQTTIQCWTLNKMDFCSSQGGDKTSFHVPHPVFGKRQLKFITIILVTNFHQLWDAAPHAVVRPPHPFRRKHSPLSSL